MQVLDSMADGPAVFKSTAAAAVDAAINGMNSNLFVTRSLIPGTGATVWAPVCTACRSFARLLNDDCTLDTASRPAVVSAG